MTFVLSNNSKKNREGINPGLIEISDLAITISLIDFGHGKDAGLRTAARQGQLYLEEKSKCNGVDNISKHQTGMALDFYAFVDGKASWERRHLAMVGAAFLQASCELGYVIHWGGLWRSRSNPLYGWDMPHVELVK